MRIFTSVLAILITMVLSASSFAQDQTPPQPPPGSRLEQLKQKIEETKYRKLREVLNLDDESAVKFFSLYKPAEQEIIDLVKQRNAEELKLLQLTQGDHKDADVDPTINNIEMLNRKIEERYNKLNDQLKTVLNPRQRAKLLVFEHEFNRRLRERIHQWREKHPDRQHPKRPNPPNVRKRK